MILLVNRDNIFNDSLLNNYELVDYENYNEDIIYVERDTLKYFEMLKMHLKVEGIIIDIADGYRSYEKQENLFLSCLNKNGMDYAEDNIDMPGYSEHHTGMAIDMAIFYNDKWFNTYDECLNDILNRIYSSLKYFGFILRYTNSNIKFTNHKPNPLHIRYIGTKDSELIGNLSLEEYVNGGYDEEN